MKNLQPVNRPGLSELAPSKATSGARKKLLDGPEGHQNLSQIEIGDVDGDFVCVGRLLALGFQRWVVFPCQLPPLLSTKLHIRVVLAKTREPQDKSRMLLVRRNCEEDAIAIAYSRSELRMPHKLAKLLRPTQMFGEEMLRLSQPPFER